MLDQETTMEKNTKQEIYEQIFQQDLKKYILELFDELIHNINIGDKITTQSKRFLKNASCADLVRLYIYNRQKIPYGKKNIYYSRELLRSPLYQAFKRKIEKISNCFKDDGNVSPYLTEKINHLIFEDRLLNDWGILHLHLNPIKERNPATDNFLLFVYIQDNNVFFLNIGHHKSFADKTLLEIIDNNWQGLLSVFKEYTSSVLSEADILKLRKMNAMYTLSINGKTAAPQMENMQYRTMLPLAVISGLKDISKLVVAIEDELITGLQKKLGKSIKMLDLHLGFDKDIRRVILYDAISEVGFDINNVDHFSLFSNILKNCNIF